MKAFAYDSCALVGAVCLVYASYQVHPALAWCMGGLSLIYYGMAGAAMLNKRGHKK